jgi:membrane protease subunit (stomatin/prohibitin family)
MVVRRRPLARAAVVGGTFAAGRAMGRRGQQSAEADQDQQAQPQQAQQAPPAQASPSMMDQLNQLTTLHQQGALNDDEFAAAKAKILSS